MRRSEPFNVAAVKCLHVYPLSVNGHKYVISGVDSDNSLVLLGSNCCTIRSISDFLREKNKFFCGDIVFKYDEENNTLCPISYELTDNSYVFYCSDEPFSVLANWEIGTYCFAKDKFPFIVPFHKFNPDNIGESLRHNVVKQQ